MDRMASTTPYKSTFVYTAPLSASMSALSSPTRPDATISTFRSSRSTSETPPSSEYPSFSRLRHDPSTSSSATKISSSSSSVLPRQNNTTDPPANVQILGSSSPSIPALPSSPSLGFFRHIDRPRTPSSPPASKSIATSRRSTRSTVPTTNRVLSRETIALRDVTDGQAEYKTSDRRQKRLGSIPVTDEEMDELVERMMKPLPVGRRQPAILTTSRTDDHISTPNDKASNQLSRHLITSLSNVSLASTTSSQRSDASISFRPTPPSSVSNSSQAETSVETLEALIQRYKKEEEARRRLRLNIPLSSGSIAADSAPRSSTPPTRRSLPAFESSPATIKPERVRIKTIDEIVESGGPQMGGNARRFTPAQLVVVSARKQILVEPAAPSRPTSPSASAVIPIPSIDSPSPTTPIEDYCEARSTASSTPTYQQRESQLALATYLNSSRLTRLLTLTRAPHRGTTVSFADVGDLDGRAVIVFVGLGCVRFLIGLYDEWAKVLGLRLICIDRWGLGKTSDIPESEKSYSNWAKIVEEVVDQLGIARFSILSHSAGAPYSMAFALRCGARVIGPLHLLSPWLSNEYASLSAGYKFLNLVPTSIIRTAQAAEWKLESWRLGKAPKRRHIPVGFDHRAPVSSSSVAIPLQMPRTSSSYSLSSSIAELEGSSTVENEENGRRGSFSNWINFSLRSESNRLSTSTSTGSLPRPRHSSTISPQYAVSLDKTPPAPPPKSSQPATSRQSFASIESTTSSRRRVSSLVEPSSLSPVDLVNGILQASHAESQGSSSDLLVILGRTGTPQDFHYSELRTPVLIWWGDRDDRISLSSLRRLEEELQECRLNIVVGADHSLMTNSRVMIEVLESLAAVR